jgi:hypothetical protein
LTRRARVWLCLSGRSLRRGVPFLSFVSWLYLFIFWLLAFGGGHGRARACGVDAGRGALWARLRGRCVAGALGTKRAAFGACACVCVRGCGLELRVRLRTLWLVCSGCVGVSAGAGCVGGLRVCVDLRLRLWGSCFVWCGASARASSGRSGYSFGLELGLEPCVWTLACACVCT